MTSFDTNRIEVTVFFCTRSQKFYFYETHSYKITAGRPGARRSHGPASEALLAAARAGGADLDSATVGMCFHEHYVPEQFQTEQQSVLVRQESSSVSVAAPEYSWVEKQILVSEASSRLETVPAVYSWAEEQVIDKPAHTIWKKGTGPIQRIDEATGEIMCLVEVPATHKTYRKRVLTSTATTQTADIPAQYKTVQVTKLAAAAQEQRIDIPAEYETVTHKELEKDGFMEWRSILCDTNMTNTRITQVQSALKSAGYNPGNIDGVIGHETISAINAFQPDKGLPVDRYLNIETVRALGVATN